MQELQRFEAALSNRLDLFSRFFLNPKKPADGPLKEDKLGIVPIKAGGIDLGELYAQINSYSTVFEISEIGGVDFNQERFPIYRISHNPRAARRILVVCGIHGFEQAAILTVPNLLTDVCSNPDIYSSVNLDFIAPANPVGAKYFSRYTGEGFDGNRDFKDPQTKEAAVIIEQITKLNPDWILSLHEGPQRSGTFLFGNRQVPEDIGLSVVDYLKQQGVTIATRDYVGEPFGRKLRTAGFVHDSFLMKIFDRWLSFRNSTTLGFYAQKLGIPAITLESSMASNNFQERLNSQVYTLRGLVKSLSDK